MTLKKPDGPPTERAAAIAGVAIVMGLVTGFTGLAAAVFAFVTFNWVGVGVCLGAAALSFGLVANAALRR
jgi:hypothetical protein